jgi:hypothetical protein
MKFLLLLLLLAGYFVQNNGPSTRYVQLQPTPDTKLIVDLSSIKKTKNKAIAQSVYIFNPPVKQHDREVKYFYRDAVYDCNAKNLKLAHGQLISTDLVVDLDSTHLNDLANLPISPAEIDTVCKTTKETTDEQEPTV